jgi:hypothetical protein
MTKRIDLSGFAAAGVVACGMGLLSSSSSFAMSMKKPFPAIEVELLDANGVGLAVVDPKQEKISPFVAEVAFTDIPGGRKVCFDRNVDTGWTWKCDPQDIEQLATTYALDGASSVHVSSALNAKRKQQVKLAFHMQVGKEAVCTNLNPDGPVNREIIVPGVMVKPWWFEGRSGIFGRYRIDKVLASGLVDQRTGKPCQDLFINESELASSGSTFKVVCKHELTNEQIVQALAEVHAEECRDDPMGKYPGSYLAAEKLGS